MRMAASSIEVQPITIGTTRANISPRQRSRDSSSTA